MYKCQPPLHLELLLNNTPIIGISPNTPINPQPAQLHQKFSIHYSHQQQNIPQMIFNTYIEHLAKGNRYPCHCLLFYSSLLIMPYI